MSQPPNCPVCGVVEATHAPCYALRRMEKKLKEAEAECNRLREAMEKNRDEHYRREEKAIASAAYEAEARQS